MPGSVIRLRDLPDDLRRIHGRIKAAAIRGMRIAAREAQGVVIREIGRVKPPLRPPVDTGEMRRASSWPVTHISEGAVLESATKQAVFQEYGTDPFTPPMEPLRAWARRKLRGGGRKKAPELVKKARYWRRQAQKHAKRAQEAAGIPGSKTRSPLGRSGAQSEEAAARALKRRTLREARKTADAERLARAAWASIRRRGIRAKGFFAAAERQFGKIVERNVRDQLRRVTK